MKKVGWFFLTVFLFSWAVWLPVEVKFTKYVPNWPFLERFGEFWRSRIAWGTGYTLVYMAFAKRPCPYLLLLAKE